MTEEIVPKLRRKHVVWSLTEWEEAVRIAVSVLKEHPEANGIQIMRKINAAFPPERGASLTDSHKGLKIRAKAVAILIKEGDQPALQSIAAPAPVNETLVAALAAVIQPFFNSIMEYPNVKEAFREMGRKASAEFMKGFSLPALPKQEEETLNTAVMDVWPAEEKGPRKVRVLVAGLRGVQMEKVKQAMQGYPMRLRFWTTDHAPHRLRDLAKGSDHVVMMIPFISHSHTDIVQAKHPGYISINGGLTELIEALKKLDKPSGV